MIRSVTRALLLSTLIAGRSFAQDQAVTVFVIRHAEKGPEQPDPSLTGAGTARATTLASLLADSKISAIFTSQFKRTRETAAPLAALAKVTVQVVDADKTDALITAIRTLGPGSRALVVSHSNLVPVIVERLSREKVGELTDADYDRLYVVTIRPEGATVLLLHYGVPSPSGTAPMRP
jgi:broad specificity phosphatase PhoE